MATRTTTNSTAAATAAAIIGVTRPPGSTSGMKPPVSVARQSDSDPMASPLARPGLRSASAPRVACSMSTYQAWAGPLDSARATPLSTEATMNSQTEVATASSASPATLKRAETARSTRRPRTSARPPVGSSRATTTIAWTEITIPTCARSRPREVMSKIIDAIIRPGGNHVRKLMSP